MEEFWKSKAIADRYEFIEELGKGGIGTVLLARDRTLNKEVAIKVLNANLTGEDSIRFQQEGILSGRLKHENIVSVFDFGVTDTNVPYLIMEHLTGFSLASMLKEEGTLDPLFAVQIFQQICRGMNSSHNQGVIHRDLKPGNIIMVPNEDESVSAKIVDFGLARLLSQDARLTVAGSAIGSPLYMSPEQGQGLAGDERSDIYSMGCLMFEVLTGSVPFVGDAVVHTLMMHQSDRPDPLYVRAQHTFPQMLEDIVARCLRKLPEDRYQSFSDLLGDLEVLEREIIRLEQAAFLEASTRSGIQRALSSVTDFSVPLASQVSRNENTLKGLIALCVVALLGFFAFLIYQTTGLSEPSHVELVPAFKRKDINTLKVEEENGEISIDGRIVTEDVNLEALRKYPKLYEVDLSESLCVGTGFRALKDTTTITKLVMNGTTPTDEGLKVIAEINGLRSLSLKDCDKFKNESLAILANCKTLVDFSFGGKEVTEGAFKYLQKYPVLKSVCLSKLHVTSNGIAEIQKVPELLSLKFQECTLDKGDFEPLEKSGRPLLNLAFSEMPLTSEMISHIEKIRTNNITLTEVETTGSAFSRMKKDPRFLWKKLIVDGKSVPDHFKSSLK